MAYHDCSERLRRLESENVALRKRIGKPERGRREADDFDDDEPGDYGSPSDAGALEGVSGVPTYMPSEPSMVMAEKARRDYASRTRPVRMSRGLGIDEGHVYGKDIVRFSLDRELSGASPLERGLQAVSRYRRRHNV
jgi:hypothetical protein